MYYRVTNIFIHSHFVIMINPLECFFGSEGHVALDRNLGPGYDTLLLRMIPGDLLSACPTHTTRPFRQSSCIFRLYLSRTVIL